MAFAALRRCAQPEEMWTVLQHVRCVRTGLRTAPATT